MEEVIALEAARPNASSLDREAFSKLRSANRYAIDALNIANNYIDAALATCAAPAALAEPVEGWRMVPIDPPEIMWGGLARAIIMWTRFNRPSEQALLRHLKESGETIPDWLAKECRDVDHVPPKGSVAVWVYRAMLDAAPDYEPPS